MMTMSCQECVEKLQPFLDRELSGAERLEVERHLSVCGYCAGSFRFEAGILHAIGRCGRATYASEEFKARIRVVVHTAITAKD
jgi:anti-sigma factor (TIGR02949 family)